MSDEMQTTRLPERAACPRCGYDQRGVIATWTESCPLRGVCSECGLTFEWIDVMRPDREGPTWCVEFARRRSVFLVCFKTAFRSLWPWHFWSRIRLNHPLRPRRLAIYIAWMIVPLLLCYVAIQSSVAVYVRYCFQQDLKLYSGQQIQAQIVQIQAYISYVQQMDSASQHNADLQTQLEAAKRQLSYLQSLSTTPASIDHSYLAAVFEAVCLPLASKSMGTISEGPAIYPYLAPNELWWWASQRFRSTQGVGPSMSDITKFAFIVLPACAYGWLVMLLIAASFVTLPVSMRRASVRWKHLVRIVVYGAFIPLLAMLLCAAVIGHAVITSSGATLGDGRVMAGAAAGSLALLALWWWAAIRCYLRIPHAFLTAMLLTVMASLLLPTIAVVMGLVVTG